MKRILLLPLLAYACAQTPSPQGKLLSSRSRHTVPMEVRYTPPSVEPEPEATLPPPPPPVLEELEIEEIFDYVEVMPEFPGGRQAMYHYFSKQVNYPSMALDMQIQGTVYVQFKVMQDGTVNDATVVRGIDSMLDREALRVVRAMPKWAPAQSSGRSVEKIMIVPIRFKIS